MTPEEIVQRYGSAVVSVEATDVLGNIRQGSGFLVYSDGRILTNEHTIRGSSYIEVCLIGGKRYEVKRVIAEDRDNDLALLKIQGPQLPTVQLGDSGAMPVGARIYVIGNPKGLENTITDGLFSGRRYIDGQKLLQISAPVSPGSSGSPVFDVNGQVVGIVKSKLSGGDDLNLAVPMYFARPLMAEGSLLRATILSKRDLGPVADLWLRYAEAVGQFRPSLSTESLFDVADTLLYYARRPDINIDARLLLTVLAQWSYLDRIVWREGELFVGDRPLQDVIEDVANNLRLHLGSDTALDGDALHAALVRYCQACDVPDPEANNLATSAVRTYRQLCGDGVIKAKVKPSKRPIRGRKRRQR